MNIISRIKCSINAKQDLRSYYESLSEQELKKRRSSLLMVFIATNLAWIFSFITILLSVRMDPPLMVFYGGVIISLVILSWGDYRRRVSLIDEILKSKKEFG